MSIQIQRRGGSTVTHRHFVGAERELTVDSDKNVIVVHDGKTPGGFPLAREDMTNVSTECIQNKGFLLLSDFIGFVFTAPLESANGYLLCDGSAVSRKNYQALFAKIGTEHGPGDRETTFNIPDYRDVFLRGMGEYSEKDFFTIQSDAIRNIKGQLTVTGNNLESYANFTNTSGAFKSGGVSHQRVFSNSSNSYSGPKILMFDASGSVPVAEENRPINKAINFFIKY